MENDVPEVAGEQAESISHDLDALRELDNADLRPAWLRQFALILLLVSAFVVIAWFSATRNDGSKPVVFNEGVIVSSDWVSADWIGLALEQAMVATIQSGEQLRLIKPIQPTATYDALGPSATSSSQSGADWVLRAVLEASDPASDAVVVHLSLKRVDAKSPTFSADILGSTHSISDLATRNTEQLFVWLEVGGLSREQLGFATNEIPSSLASELYGKGLAALTGGRAREALEHLGEANAVASNNAAIHEAMANAWDHLGYAENAARESALALNASDKLSRRRQLELEAAHARRSEDWSRSEQVFAALKEFSPRNLSYRLAVADSQTHQNNSEGFVESIRQMRAMDGTTSDDPRIDLAEAGFWYRSGDYERCFSLARAAEAKARQSNDRYILGEALLSAGRCDDTYDPDILLQARAVFTSLRTNVREPEILRELAKHEFSKGDIQSYLEYSEEAVAQAIRLGNEPEVAASQNSLAIAYDLRGWLTRGYELKLQIAQYQKQRNNLNRYSIVLENIGVSLFKLGRYDEAESTIDQAELVFREIDDKIGIAWLPYRRGQIALRRGKIQAARELMTQAVENAAERPEGGLASEATFELGLIEFYAGNFDKSKSLLDDANKYYRNGGLSASIAETEIALARLANATQQGDAAGRHLADAEELLAAETAYYLMSLRAEQVDFALPRSPVERQRLCKQLTDAVVNQEHREYLLRAKTKIVACRGLLDGQPYAVSHAMLVAVEEEVRKSGLFEAQLSVGYVRAALLQHAGRIDEAAAENARVNAIASAHNWRPHPIPDLMVQ